MSNIRLENSTNPVHLVTPQRVVVPMPKLFDAPPGVVPFHRMLASVNLATRSSEASTHPIEIPRQTDSFEPSVSTQLLPKLGEVLPVTPTAPAPIEIQENHQVQLPATGQLLDIYL